MSNNIENFSILTIIRWKNRSETKWTRFVPYPWLPLNSLALQFPEVRIARGKIVASLYVAHYTRVLTHATHPT